MMPAGMPEEKDKNKPNKPPEAEKKPWADIWGENEVDVSKDGEIKITDRKTGDVTLNPDKEPSSFFGQLDRADQDAVIVEIEKFKNSEEVIGFSASELIEEIDRKREELSKEILDAKEGETEKAAA